MLKISSLNRLWEAVNHGERLFHPEVCLARRDFQRYRAANLLLRCKSGCGRRLTAVKAGISGDRHILIRPMNSSGHFARRPRLRFVELLNGVIEKSAWKTPPGRLLDARIKTNSFDCNADGRVRGHRGFGGTIAIDACEVSTIKLLEEKTS
jgi:hypothetical protein